MRPNQPTKVTLFDVDYVIAMASIKDPQKSRHSTISVRTRWQRSRNVTSRRLDSFSVPTTVGPLMVVTPALANKFRKRWLDPQGMLWLWLGTATHQLLLLMPPTVPEMDDPDFTMTRVIRDFPQIDWTLLVSNILDPTMACLHTKCCHLTGILPLPTIR